MNLSVKDPTLASTPPKRHGWGTQARCLAVAAGLLLGASPGGAASVSHIVVNLSDVTVGEDLWEYDFTLQGPLPLFNSVNLLFGPDTHSQISVLGNATPADLELALSPPAPGLGTDILLAQGDLPASFIGTVALSFVWTGTGTPVTVDYEVVDENFNVLESGLSNPVPEPASWALLLAGITALLVGLRRPAPGTAKRVTRCARCSS